MTEPLFKELPGTVAVTADEAGRYTQFAICMQGLLIPPGSKTLWQVGNDIAGNRNRAVEQMDGKWIWWIDDDHAFPPGILKELLRHDVDIVAPLCLRRQQPFDPVSFTSRDSITVLPLHDLPESGLVEVEACGSAGMLVKRHVFDALEPPYFRMTEDGISEDIYFSDKARAAGFKIHTDLGTPLGHITTAVVWPTYAEGEWRTGFTLGDGFKLQTQLLWERSEDT